VISLRPPTPSVPPPDPAPPEPPPAASQPAPDTEPEPEQETPQPDPPDSVRPGPQRGPDPPPVEPVPETPTSQHGDPGLETPPSDDHGRDAVDPILEHELPVSLDKAPCDPRHTPIGSIDLSQGLDETEDTWDLRPLRFGRASSEDRAAARWNRAAALQLLGLIDDDVFVDQTARMLRFQAYKFWRSVSNRTLSEVILAAALNDPPSGSKTNSDEPPVNPAPVKPEPPNVPVSPEPPINSVKPDPPPTPVNDDPEPTEPPPAASRPRPATEETEEPPPAAKPVPEPSTEQPDARPPDSLNLGQAIDAVYRLVRDRVTYHGSDLTCEMVADVLKQFPLAEWDTDDLVALGEQLNYCSAWVEHEALAHAYFQYDHTTKLFASTNAVLTYEGAERGLQIHSWSSIEQQLARALADERRRIAERQREQRSRDILRARLPKVRKLKAMKALIDEIITCQPSIREQGRQVIEHIRAMSRDDPQFAGCTTFMQYLDKAKEIIEQIPEGPSRISD
jgi:hypothetical protein